MSNLVQTTVGANGLYDPLIRFNEAANPTPLVSGTQWTAGIQDQATAGHYVVCGDNDLQTPFFDIAPNGDITIAENMTVQGNLTVDGTITGNINVVLENPIMEGSIASIGTTNTVIETPILNIASADGRKIASATQAGGADTDVTITLDNTIAGNTTTTYYTVAAYVNLQGVAGLSGVYQIASITDAYNFVLTVTSGTLGVVSADAYCFIVSAASTLNNAGLYLRAQTAGAEADKTILYNSTNDNWNSNLNMNLASGKIYEINDVQKLSATDVGTNAANMTNVYTQNAISATSLALTGATGISSTATAGNITNTAAAGDLTNNAVNISNTATTAASLTAPLTTIIGNSANANAVQIEAIDAAGGITLFAGDIVAASANTATMDLTTTVFNANGAANALNVDFQVQGPTNANLLFVQGQATSENSTLTTQIGWSTGTYTLAVTAAPTTPFAIGQMVTFSGGTALDGQSFAITAVPTTTTFSFAHSFVGAINGGTITRNFSNEGVGILKVPSTGVALDVNGPIVGSSSITSYSDRTFKKNIETFETAQAFNTVLQMRPVRYDWRVDEFPDRAFSKNRDLGFIAQEMKVLVPEVVRGQDGDMSVDYAKIVAVLTAAVQHLSSKVADLEARLQ